MFSSWKSPSPRPVVLDGLEKIQDDGARGGVFGRIENGHLRDLALRASRGYFPRLSLLITTRFVLLPGA